MLNRCELNLRASGWHACDFGTSLLPSIRDRQKRMSDYFSTGPADGILAVLCRSNGKFGISV